MAPLGRSRRWMALGLAACLAGAGGCGASLGVVGIDPYPGGLDVEIVPLIGQRLDCSHAGMHRAAARRPPECPGGKEWAHDR